MEKDLNYKILFTFEVPKESEVEVETTVFNEETKTETITKKKEKKIVNQKFFVKKPSRGLKEDAEVFYSATYGKLLEAGLMPAVLVEKRYVQDGGVLSEAEIKLRKELYTDLLETSNDVEKAKKADEKDKLVELESKVTDLITAISEIEQKNQGLFSNTAEAKAKDRLIVYYTLFSSFNYEDGKVVPFFGAGTYDERRDKLSEYEDTGDSFLIKVVSAFLGIVSIYFSNPKITQEDIDKFVVELLKN